MATPTSKTIILTGANSGIGLEAAKELCKRGHDVVISVRDDAKGEDTIKQLKESAPDAKVMYLVMEMSEPDSIKAFVDKFHATGKALNVLVNNAGVFPSYSESIRMTPQNKPELELSMMVNCMGTFLLTNLLLEDLKKSGTKEDPSRIVNVSSSMVNRESNDWWFDMDDVMLEKPGSYKSGAQAYRRSKVALNLWSNEMAKRLEGSPVIINTLCPGFIPGTNLARNVPQSIGKTIFIAVFDSFIGRALIKTKPVSEGRRRVVEMSLDEKFSKTNGTYYRDDVPTEEPKDVLNEEHQKQIWDLCVKYSQLNKYQSQ